MTVGYLYTLAGEVLSAAEDALVEATTGHGPPSSSYVSHGPPSLLDHCCEDGVLTVHLELLEHRAMFDLISAGPVAAGKPCAVQGWATFVITLGRCTPTFQADGAVPSEALIEGTAEDLLIDLWAITTELWDRAYACTLYAAQTACEDVEFGETTPLEAEGGCGGWEIRVRVGCNDTGPIGS